MNPTILITGAHGRLGQAAVSAFLRHGWNVHTLVRKATSGNVEISTDAQNNAENDATQKSAPNMTEFVGDARDVQILSAAAAGCDVILPAANPSYELWESVVPATTQALITVAASVGASIVLPGNVYAYGSEMPATINADTPHNPTCLYGEIRSDMERELEAAAKSHGVQTLVVRAGGYMEGRNTGNWFESYMCKDLHKNQFMYPGATDVACAWAYLPDVAEVMVSVATMREQLLPFDDIGVPGYSITGAELHRLVEASTGKALKLTSLPWVIIKLMSWFKPMMRGVYDMRYLFHVPHSISGSRLKEIMPDWTGTTTEEAISMTLAGMAWMYSKSSIGNRDN